MYFLSLALSLSPLTRSPVLSPLSVSFTINVIFSPYFFKNIKIIRFLDLALLLPTLLWSSLLQVSEISQNWEYQVSVVFLEMPRKRRRKRKERAEEEIVDLKIQPFFLNNVFREQAGVRSALVWLRLPLHCF